MKWWHQSQQHLITIAVIKIL